jgi:hypothetical protein
MSSCVGVAVRRSHGREVAQAAMSLQAWLKQQVAAPWQLVVAP